MSKEARLTIAQKALLAFLERRRPPVSFTSDQMIDEIRDLADALVRKIAARDEDAFAETIQQTFRNFRDTVDSTYWPSQAALIAAIPKQPASNDPPTPFVVDEMEFLAERMARGLAVPDHVLWGPISDKLIASGTVAEATFDAYRRGIIRDFIETYGTDARSLAISRFGPLSIRILDELGAPTPPTPLAAMVPENATPSVPNEDEASTTNSEQGALKKYRPFGGTPDQAELEKARAANTLIAQARADYARQQKGRGSE